MGDFMIKEETYIYGNADYDQEGIEKENQLVEEEYKMNMKSGKYKMNSRLKKEYEALKSRTKKVGNVRNVVFIKDAYLGRRLMSKELYSFIVVETDKGISLMYNVTTGEDHSFDFNREIHIIKDKTKIIKLYDCNCKDYQDVLDVGYMESITLYKNASLINNYTNKLINKFYYIEFKDRLGHVFYIDFLFNHLYFRKNSYELLEGSKTKKEKLFDYGKHNEVSIKLFKNTLFDIIKLLFEFDE